MRDSQDLEVENEELTSQLKDTNKNLDLLLKIVELDDRVVDYLKIVRGCYDIPEVEWYSYISHSLEISKIHTARYEREVSNMCDLFKQALQRDEMDSVENFIRLINEWVCTSITYDGFEEEQQCKREGRPHKERDLWEFLEDKQGCCWHIGHLVSDLCRAYGFEMKLHKGIYEGHGRHLWNSAIIDGKEVYFDFTFNLTSDGESNDKYLFVNREDFMVDRRELYGY